LALSDRQTIRPVSIVDAGLFSGPIRSGYNSTMRRFGRWMFNGLAALSLLLCVATAALWARSYFASAVIVYRPPIDWVRREYGVFCPRGSIAVFVEPTMLVPGWHVESQPSKTLPQHFPPDMNVLNLRIIQLVRRPARPGNVGAYLLCVDGWLVAIAFAALPAFRALVWRRQRRERDAREGLCPACRYNLTGNVSGVCPECGTPIASKT
jgi:hypothetical protein